MDHYKRIAVDIPKLLQEVPTLTFEVTKLLEIDFQHSKISLADLELTKSPQVHHYGLGHYLPLKCTMLLYPIINPEK